MTRNCRNSIKKAKAGYELRIGREAKHNKKAFFTYLQNKRHEKEKGVQVVKVDGRVIIDDKGKAENKRHENEKDVFPLKVDDRVITDDKEKAEALNSYFASVFSLKKMYNQEEVQAESERWQPKTDTQMVKEYLGGINTFKSPGPDEFHPRVIKELVEEFSEPLAIIFDKSWKTGEVPDNWRMANIDPIFKKGGKGEPGNYRPVSLSRWGKMVTE
ncbi:hypothetical protein EYD10_06815 [Varanus komodoensis]|nr:hypothetical protein EYD10_06815 [Varanus komodoensis]